MTDTTKVKEDELKAFVNGWLVEVAFGVYDREDLPGLADNMLNTLTPLIDKYTRERAVDGNTSDGYHTFNELYGYRLAYNAALFNEWAAQGKYEVHKSKKHSDGEPCFDGTYFVVVAQLPSGQITNHYKLKYWDSFQIPERELASEYDGHTPKEALNRLAQLTEQKDGE